MSAPSYVVITPVRDEAPRLARTIASVASQSVPVSRWVVVNDGSTDGTAEILDAAAREHRWMTVVHAGKRAARAPGSAVMEAFYRGFGLIADEPWDFLVKLDGDLAFDEHYFRACFDRFAADPQLGIGGGTVCVEQNGEVQVESPSDPTFHVRGATKIYRRRCFDDIAPLVRQPGWDTIDEVKANFKGWRTRTFPDVRLIQTKETGSADGTWTNAFKNGRANYITGYDPLFMAMKCAKRALARPLLICGVAMAAGYVSGYLREVPRGTEPAVIRYLREQQRRRLCLRSSIYG